MMGKLKPEGVASGGITTRVGLTRIRPHDFERKRGGNIKRKLTTVKALLGSHEGLNLWRSGQKRGFLGKTLEGKGSGVGSRIKDVLKFRRVVNPTATRQKRGRSARSQRM